MAAGMKGSETLLRVQQFVLPSVRPVAVGSVVALAALGLGATAARLGAGHATLAIVLCLAPAALCLFWAPRISAFLLAACLPFSANLAGGSAGGVNAAASDLVLFGSVVGLLAAVGTGGLANRLRRLRPMVPLLVVYFAAVALSVAAHPSFKAFVTSVQRGELVILSMVLGASLRAPQDFKRAMQIFIAAAVVLAALWLPFHLPSVSLLTDQKNPAGQFITDGLLISIVVVRRLKLRIVLVVILGAGVFATQSRGALIGLCLGLIVYFALTSHHLARFAVRLGAALVIGTIFILLLPPSTRDRLTGNGENVQRSDQYRRDYAADAIAIIKENPVVGVGVGNYVAGSASDLTLTSDPHDVWLLETAEGGFLLAGAFAVLQFGTLFVLFRRRKQSIHVPLAIAVQVATVAHSFVDVYWVRGTPVMGWFLVGVALATTRTKTVSDHLSEISEPAAVEA